MNETGERGILPRNRGTQPLENIGFGGSVWQFWSIRPRDPKTHREGWAIFWTTLPLRRYRCRTRTHSSLRILWLMSLLKEKRRLKSLSFR